MKEKLIKPVYFVALVLSMLVTGVFWGTWFTLTRSIETFSSTEFIHIGQTIISNVAVPMRIIMPSSIVFTIISAWLYPTKKSVGFYFNIAANILIIVTLLITLLVLVPIDNQIRLWSGTTIPADFASLRNTWQWFHSLRTVTSLTSFASIALSIILSLSAHN
jgi:Anthrone oxygenase